MYGDAECLKNVIKCPRPFYCIDCDHMIDCLNMIELMDAAKGGEDDVHNGDDNEEVL